MTKSVQSLKSEIKEILVRRYGRTVSARRIADMIRGNPMITADSSTEELASLIDSHLED